MSDSFADLWNSSAPTSSKPIQPPKLGSATANPSVAPKRAQHDVFSLLSSAGSSTNSSRAITPSTLPQQKPQAKPPPPLSKPTTTTGGDAFSGLFDGSLSGSGVSSNGNGARMTIAERAAQVEKDRLASLQRHQQSVKQTSSAWDGLDSLGGTHSPSLSKPSNIVQDDDWGFGTAAIPTQPTPKPKLKAAPKPADADDDDDWGLGDFAAPAAIVQPQARPPLSQSQSQSKPQAIWDMGEFADASPSRQSPPQIAPTNQRSDSPGDFDFGNREDRLLDDDDSNDEDDILGALSKPINSIPKRKSPSNERPTQPPSPLPSHAPQSPSRGTSPPPHILGQIVEMGFSVQQARIALASTDTGLDIQAALDTLLSNGAASSSTPPQRPSPSPVPAPGPGQGQGTRGKPNRTAGRLMSQDRDAPSPSPSNSQSERDKERNIQDQADKLISQASEIGLSAFNKVSSFWKEGKERVQKAYEERAGSASAAASGIGIGAGEAHTQRVNGRPKWMQESPAAAERGVDAGVEDDGWRDGPEGSGFSDDVLPQRPKPTPKAKPASKPKPEPGPPLGDLFSDDPEPVTYQSPFRRGKPQQPIAGSTSRTPPQSQQSQSQHRTPSPLLPLPRQNLISASTSSISRSQKHKDLGASKFQLGQYSDAEASYTASIACLPPSHLLLIPLYNNRALTRLHTGDYRGAIDDATTVLELIGAGYHPAREAKVEGEQEGAGVDLGDAWVKALKRRARAWEGREKWEEAGRDWEVLACLEWAGAGVRSEAVQGAGRCRRTAQAQARADGDGRDGEVGSTRSAAKPKPPPPSKRERVPPKRPTTTSLPPSQALENLRSATNAAEAEDQQRHELKDKVDAKLLAWKGGKETNIRALLGSLDSVLWPELGLAKVGMADLVSAGQVKGRYTRVIAKLHPDKLNAGNTTVEQRMLANGVFGALNEAWNAFKQ